jgi:hypothetical protein
VEPVVSAADTADVAATAAAAATVAVPDEPAPVLPPPAAFVSRPFSLRALDAYRANLSVPPSVVFEQCDPDEFASVAKWGPHDNVVTAVTIIAHGSFSHWTDYHDYAVSLALKGQLVFTIDQSVPDEGSDQLTVTEPHISADLEVFMTKMRHKYPAVPLIVVGPEVEQKKIPFGVEFKSCHDDSAGATKRINLLKWVPTSARAQAVEDYHAIGCSLASRGRLYVFSLMCGQLTNSFLSHMTLQCIRVFVCCFFFFGRICCVLY